MAKSTKTKPAPDPASSIKDQESIPEAEAQKSPASQPSPAEVSYFHQRITTDLRLSPALNKIKLKIDNLETGVPQSVEHKIFDEDEDGNIVMTPFDLDGFLIEYDNKSATPTRPNINNSRRKTFKVTRFKQPQTYTDPRTGKEEVKKYEFPKGAKTQPFITPGILHKYAKREKIQTLVLTEGYLKAAAGWLNGLDIIGLSSISHFKDAETQTMYTDILRVIDDCFVENVILLYDGDARNISTSDLQANRDIRKRPLHFIAMAIAARELLKDKKIDIYYAEINSANIAGNPKGLDDLYKQLPAEANAITTDLISFSRPCVYFNRLSIRLDPAKLYAWFQMTTVNIFYTFHAAVIQGREFVYNNTTYTYNEKSGDCDIKIPGETSDYFRVGVDYYKFGNVPNKYQQHERRFFRWTKATIRDDHPEKYTQLAKYLPKYFAFCNVPDHVNYQPVINNCFNVYAPFEHEPAEGDCPVILEFIKHIFQEHYEFGLDYVQLLYQKPTQILPILCLVSKENNTGKSTFVKLMKAIFKQNCTIIGNADLNNDFNAGWSTKLIVGCEETLVDKTSAIEKLKALSTADQISMNRKGKDQEEIDFFAKFILCSNKEKGFIYASKDDIRYWVRKVPVITKVRVKMLEDMIEEIPAFLNFLNARAMFTSYESRMWFAPYLLRTDAFDRIVQNSRTGLEKEIYEFVKDIFFDFGETEIMLTPKAIIDLILKRKADSSYVATIIKENFKAELYDTGKARQFKVPYWAEDVFMGEKTVVRKEHVLIGRPYCFAVEKILEKSDYKTFLELHGTTHETATIQNPAAPAATVPPPPTPADDPELEKDLPF